MPIIYLSPSTQEWNYFVTGGTEEQYMNQLADLMVPYLDASGTVSYTHLIEKLIILICQRPSIYFRQMGGRLCFLG